MAVKFLDTSNGYTENVPEWTTETPVHAYEMNVRMELIMSSIVAVHNMVVNDKNARGIYTGDKKPDADTFLWFAPIDYVDDNSADTAEIILEAVAYTGDQTKMHVATADGKTYTADNTAVTNDGGTPVITIRQ